MYNLSKKRSKEAQSVAQYESMLNDNRDRHDLSLSGEVVPNYSGLLSEQRDNESLDSIQENRLDTTRNDAIHADDKIAEKNIDESSLNISGRANQEKAQIMPIHILHEAYESKRRDEIKESDSDTLSTKTDFWDKYIGTQLSGDKTTAVGGVADDGSQLGNNPERFNNFNSVPHELDQSKNKGCHTEESGIDHMHGFGKEAQKIMKESLKDSDAILFHVYATVAREDRTLTKREQILVDGITKDKENIINNFLNEADAKVDPIDQQYDTYQDQRSGEPSLEDGGDPESVPGTNRHIDDEELAKEKANYYNLGNKEKYKSPKTPW